MRYDELYYLNDDNEILDRMIESEKYNFE